MISCEIVAVSSWEDALATPCGRYAVSPCTDCGTALYLSHAETYHICHKVFCGAFFVWMDTRSQPNRMTRVPLRREPRRPSTTRPTRLL